VYAVDSNTVNVQSLQDITQVLTLLGYAVRCHLTSHLRAMRTVTPV
jgi:hypothetical protein